MESIAPMTLWLAFLAFIACMLILDLGVFHRHARRVSFREAATWSAVWVALAAAFGVGIYAYFGRELALEFAAGFVIEKALAVDNMFVFAMIFASFGIPLAYQHRILFWGILGAVVLRAIMIGVGGALLHYFHWTIYVFGVLLVLTGIKFLLDKNEAMRPAESAWVRALSRIVPVSNQLEGERFFIRRHGRLFATPMLLSLLAVELSDVVFAVDSIPAIFGVTKDPFIVFTSNIFAILGLRSMYFLLANLIESFAYLKVGLSAVLVFVGLKMMFVDVVAIPAGASLGIIALILGSAMLASAVIRPAPTSIRHVD